MKQLEKLAAEKSNKSDNNRKMKWYDPMISRPTARDAGEHRRMQAHKAVGTGTGGALGGVLGAGAGHIAGKALGLDEFERANLTGAGGAIGTLVGAGSGRVAGGITGGGAVMKRRERKGQKVLNEHDFRSKM